MGKLSIPKFKVHRYLEAAVWIVGLTLMALSDPWANDHYSLCLIKNSGLGFCPGCGLGHSIGFLARGEWIQSFKSHPLGIIAIIILSYRVYTIFKNTPIKTNRNEQNN